MYSPSGPKITLPQPRRPSVANPANPVSYATISPPAISNSVVWSGSRPSRRSRLAGAIEQVAPVSTRAVTVSPAEKSTGLMVTSALKVPIALSPQGRRGFEAILAVAAIPGCYCAVVGIRSSMTTAPPSHRSIARWQGDSRATPTIGLSPIIYARTSMGWPCHSRPAR